MLAYHRTTHSLNLAHPLYTALAADAPARMGLPQSYSAKCILLKNVAAKDVLFASTEKSGVESLAMAIRRGQVAKAEVAAAAAQVGDGWISWVGDVNSEADVNSETGSTQTILVLLGLKG